MGTFLSWIGGGISGAAATGLVIGIFFMVTGGLPWEFVVELIADPPYWLTNSFVKFLLIIVGLIIIFVSLRWNLWSRRQKAIDDLAEDLSWAINNLLNRNPCPSTQTDIDNWAKEYRGWCAKISGQLDSRAFFTRADQLHFDRLGFIDPIQMSGQPNYDWWLGQLRLKFERLRDVINWTQMRRR